MALLAVSLFIGIGVACTLVMVGMCQAAAAADRRMRAQVIDERQDTCGPR